MNIAISNGQRILTFLVVFMLLFAPFMVLAQPSFVGDVVPDCSLNPDGTPNPGGACGYCHLMTLAERIVEFLIFFAIVVAILMIIYAGWLYLTAGSNAGQVTKAHSALRAAIFGLVLVLAAWLIISTILVMLGAKPNIASPITLPGC